MANRVQKNEPSSLNVSVPPIPSHGPQELACEENLTVESGLFWSLDETDHHAASLLVLSMVPIEFYPEYALRSHRLLLSSPLSDWVFKTSTLFSGDIDRDSPVAQRVGSETRSASGG